jgi:hypothetical protein
MMVKDGGAQRARCRGDSPGAAPEKEERTMTDVAVQRRPRNRKQLIVAAAAKQFERRGIHDAAITDIAADVGITGCIAISEVSRICSPRRSFEIEGLEAAYAAPQPGLRDLLEYASAARPFARSGRRTPGDAPVRPHPTVRTAVGGPPADAKCRPRRTTTEPFHSHQ